MKRLTAIWVITILLSGAAAAWAADMPAAVVDGAKKEGKLIWWGTDSPSISKKVIAAFNQKYPFVKVEYTKGVGTDFGDRILMEADAGVCSVDLVNGADSFLNQMLERGIPRNIGNFPHMKIWPEGAKDPKGFWFGMNVTYWILAYNTKLVSAADLPKSYEDIADPKWKGQFAIEERPDQWFLGLWQAWGPEKATKMLEKILANKPYIGKGYTAMAELLVAGQFKFAVPMQDYKIIQFREKKAPMEWVPLRPTEITFQGAHIMKKAPHPNAVELFVRWLTSKEGQQAYSRATAKASLHPDLSAEDPLPMPKNLETVYRTPESYKLMPAVTETYNRLVHGM